MKVVRSNFAHDLTKVAVVATITSFAAAGSLTYAALGTFTILSRRSNRRTVGSPHEGYV
jgi:hypothetical protein